MIALCCKLSSIYMCVRKCRYKCIVEAVVCFQIITFCQCLCIDLEWDVYYILKLYLPSVMHLCQELRLCHVDLGHS